MITSQILRYPVKGLRAELLDGLELAPAQRLAGDRRYAIAPIDNDGTDPAKKGRWRPKTDFCQLFNRPLLAAFEIGFKDGGQTALLPASDPAGPAAALNLASPDGRHQLARAIGDFLDRGHPNKPHESGPDLEIICSAEGGFTDVRHPYISLAGCRSAEQLCALAGLATSLARFRMNIWLEGPAPFAELDWIGRQLRLGGAVLEICAPVGRCAATHANPETGQIDSDLVRLSQQHFGHSQLGVYAKVIKGGEVKTGDRAQLI